MKLQQDFLVQRTSNTAPNSKSTSIECWISTSECLMSTMESWMSMVKIIESFRWNGRLMNRVTAGFGETSILYILNVSQLSEYLEKLTERQLTGYCAKNKSAERHHDSEITDTVTQKSLPAIFVLQQCTIMALVLLRYEWTNLRLNEWGKSWRFRKEIDQRESWQQQTTQTWFMSYNQAKHPSSGSGVNIGSQMVQKKSFSA